ncbi:hypothetical protein [Aureimonas pseudogalii]|uniref:Flagellar FliJ protein n=1 Tax=Aureimonas pseudogalii TaxID=1744844 RepID=A0A7W6E8U2_9HYPH|nr:hypothetical protein [Aureimonas pseudogalii]MBB3996384.1 hypothetical protein [Aureimonas pseudogalii]
MRGGSRSDRLGRVLAVQQQKRKLAEWKLAEMVREEEALRATEIELLDTLGRQSLMQGLFLDAKVSALRRNDLALRETQERQAAARGALTEIRRIEKRIERATETAARADRSAAERVGLLEALDEHLVAQAASFK